MWKREDIVLTYQFTLWPIKNGNLCLAIPTVIRSPLAIYSLLTQLPFLIFIKKRLVNPVYDVVLTNISAILSVQSDQDRRRRYLELANLYPNLRPILGLDHEQELLPLQSQQNSGSDLYPSNQLDKDIHLQLN